MMVLFNLSEAAAASLELPKIAKTLIYTFDLGEFVRQVQQRERTQPRSNSTTGIKLVVTTPKTQINLCSKGNCLGPSPPLRFPSCAAARMAFLSSTFVKILWELGTN